MGLNLGNYYDNVTSNAVTSGKYSSQDDVIRKALNPS
jgi:Arc/MetJ-type ribon-helix-helix transcriptional regulator